MTLDDFVDALPPDTFSALASAVATRRTRESSMAPAPTPGAGDLATIAEVEKAHILEILRRQHGNRSDAARILGIGERTLFRKLASYGIGRKFKVGVS